MNTITALRSIYQVKQNQVGGALAESILIVGVLSIFMAGVPMIGSMIDLKQTTIQASRYSAWEKTVNVNPGHTGTQINERFFKDASAPISSSANGGLAQNVMWGQPSQPQNPDDPNATTTDEGTAPGGQGAMSNARLTISDGAGQASSAVDTVATGPVYNGVSEVVTTLGSFISPDGWDDNDPVGDGLVRSTVSAPMQENTFLAAGTTLSEQTSIFIDGWSAADHETIKERVHGFVPTNRLERVGDFISRVKFIPMLNDLEHLEKAFGCVKTNIVPGKTYAPVSDSNTGLTIYGMNPGEDC